MDEAKRARQLKHIEEAIAHADRLHDAQEQAAAEAALAKPLRKQQRDLELTFHPNHGRPQ